MKLNVAIFFLAAALDSEVVRTSLLAGAAAEDSGTGAPVYHVKHAKHALLHAPAADSSNATSADASNATAADAANSTTATNATAAASSNATEPAVDEDVAQPADKDKAMHPDVVVHQKKAGGGYLKGSPLYAGNGTVGGKTKGKFTDDNYPPVSTTMQCVIQLASQYFIIYSILALVNSYNEFADHFPQYKSSMVERVARILEAAKETVNFAPMLAVLCLGVRLRALQLSGGDPDKHGLPQDYVKTGMWLATTSVLCQTILVIIIPFTLGGLPQMDPEGMPVITSGDMLARVLIAIRWVLMLSLYGGFIVICTGAYLMEAPTEVYPSGAPPVSPAVSCTMNLCMQYFAIYAAVAAINTYVQFYSRDITFFWAKLKVTLTLAKNTVNFAPMLSILFIGARMRALQMDPLNGNPPVWAQNCMYTCTFAVLLQLLFVLAIPLLFNGHVLGNKDLEGDVAFEVENPQLFYIMNIVRYLIMLAMYGGAIAVICSVCTMTAPGGMPTPPVSTTMICVINLTIQFFLVYAYLWVLLTLKSLSGDGASMLGDSVGSAVKAMMPTAAAATKTVQFCPMLCILFVGTRLRALQLSDQQGAPQGFVQDAMYLCTFALLIQLVMVFLLPLFQGQRLEYNQETSLTQAKAMHPVAWGTIVAIRYVALLFLYGGACTVVYGLFTIKPSTATGEGDLIPGLSVDPPPSVAM